jgi:hypothetical protein
MSRFWTNVGFYIGFVFFIFIYFYAIFDAYLKYKNGESIVSNLALLFAFFAWRKVHQMDFNLKYYLSDKK